MKILVVVRCLKKGGGISEWIVNYYNSLCIHEDISIDLVSEEVYDPKGSLVLNENINVINTSSFQHDFIKYYQDWKKILDNNEKKYDYIHIHTDNFVRFVYLHLLRKNKNVIIHSHNSFNKYVENSTTKKALHQIGKKIVKKANFIHFSCSDLAAKWLFDDQKYIQVNNGVDLEKFKFNIDIRKRLVETLNLENKTVYGHIGRLSYQKNHEKLIEIFKNIHQKDSNSILLLVGAGELEDQIKQQVTENNLTESVIFLGIRNDVNELLNAMDYIIFPSYYEGLPISLVEAQANGVPVFYADTITKEVCLLPESFSFSLSESSNEIAERIVSKRILIDRKKANHVVKDKGYDKADVVDWLYRFYKGEVQI